MENKTINQNFEIKEITDDSIIYQRVLNPNSKNSKNFKKILANLPTATLHTITLDEYEHLKAIEIKLLDEIKFKKPNENKFKKAFFSFFEL